MFVCVCVFPEAVGLLGGVGMGRWGEGGGRRLKSRDINNSVMFGLGVCNQNICSFHTHIESAGSSLVRAPDL